MLIQLIADTVATIGILGGTQLTYKKYWSKKHRPNITGIYTWKEMHRGGVKFRCPKCQYQPKWSNAFSKEGSLPICLCEEYHYEHFHFQCIGDPKYHCGFTCIVRSADDFD